MEINGIKACRPASNIHEQYNKCTEEIGELGVAIEEYCADKTEKKRAEIAFEALDAMTALATLLDLYFNRDEINNAIIYTNAKNYVRGYTY